MGNLGVVVNWGRGSKIGVSNGEESSFEQGWERVDVRM